MGDARNSRGATVEAVVKVWERPKDRSQTAGCESSRKVLGRKQTVE
jgi:hypothetical protein